MGPSRVRLPRASAPLFAALGDETRLGVVARLSSEGPLSIVELTEGTNVTRQAISKHLRVLAEAGLVSHERSGQRSVYALETRRLADAKRLIDTLSSRWDGTLERLRAYVEDETPP